MTDERIERLETRQDDSDKERQATELKVATMGSDVSHIKDRIDNHLSASIKGIFLKLDELAPLVKENAYWVGSGKKAVVWFAVVGVGGSIITLAVYLLKAFMTR